MRRKEPSDLALSRAANARLLGSRTGFADFPLYHCRRRAPLLQTVLGAHGWQKFAENVLGVMGPGSLLSNLALAKLGHTPDG